MTLFYNKKIEKNISYLSPIIVNIINFDTKVFKMNTDKLKEDFNNRLIKYNNDRSLVIKDYCDDHTISETIMGIDNDNPINIFNKQARHDYIINLIDSNIFSDDEINEIVSSYNNHELIKYINEELIEFSFDNIRLFKRLFEVAISSDSYYYLDLNFLFKRAIYNQAIEVIEVLLEKKYAIDINIIKNYLKEDFDEIYDNFEDWYIEPKYNRDPCDHEGSDYAFYFDYTYLLFNTYKNDIISYLELNNDYIQNLFYHLVCHNKQYLIIFILKNAHIKYEKTIDHIYTEHSILDDDDLDFFKALLDNGVIIQDYYYVYKQSAINGNLNIIKYLEKIFNFEFNDDDKYWLLLNHDDDLTEYFLNKFNDLVFNKDQFSKELSNRTSLRIIEKYCNDIINDNDLIYEIFTTKYNKIISDGNLDYLIENGAKINNDINILIDYINKYYFDKKPLYHHIKHIQYLLQLGIKVNDEVIEVAKKKNNNKLLKLLFEYYDDEPNPKKIKL